MDKYTKLNILFISNKKQKPTSGKKLIPAQFPEQ